MGWLIAESGIRNDMGVVPMCLRQQQVFSCRVAMETAAIYSSQEGDEQGSMNVDMHVTGKNIIT